MRGLMNDKSSDKAHELESRRYYTSIGLVPAAVSAAR
jgi:hypothetical protein